MCFHTMQSKLAVQIERRFKAEIRAKYEGVTQNQNIGFTFLKSHCIKRINWDIWALRLGLNIAMYKEEKNKYVANPLN
jgi:hypothetical protein